MTNTKNKPPRYYNGCITAEKFMFNEIKITAPLYLEGKTVEEAIAYVGKDNLFQYPTERMVSRFVRACYKRLDALGNNNLVQGIINAPTGAAKQINLYAIMRYNGLVKDFMINLIGQKFRSHDFSYTKRDINRFFAELRERDEGVAVWSDSTVSRIKSVLNRGLIETKILDGPRSVNLNPIFISPELKDGIIDNNDTGALAAFNCLEVY